MNNNLAAVIPKIGQLLLRANGKASFAAELGELTGARPEVIRILKASVGAGNLGDPAWAGTLADMPAASTAFLQSLGDRSAFAVLLENGIITRAPLRSAVVADVSGVVGYEVGEGGGTPVSKANLRGNTLTPVNAQAMVILTEEAISRSGPAAFTFITRQMRKGVARVLDAGLYSQLVGDSSPPDIPIYAASGTDAAAMRADLKKLLDDVNTGDGRMAWIAAKDVANSAAVLDERGTVSPQGLSEFMGLPFAVSTGLTDGTLMLIDGDQVCADIETFGIEVARYAAVQMDSAPTQSSATPTATELVSLWQTHSAGLRLTARFAAQRGTDAAVAVLTDIAWD